MSCENGRGNLSKPHRSQEGKYSWSIEPAHEGIRKQGLWWAVVPRNNQESQKARSQISECKVREHERLCQGSCWP